MRNYFMPRYVDDDTVLLLSQVLTSDLSDLLRPR